MLVGDAAALEQADPLAPVLPINAARAASSLTLTGHREKLGVVLRSCEIRALVELVKFQQAKLDGRPDRRHRLPGHLQGGRLAEGQGRPGARSERGGGGRGQAAGRAAVPGSVPDLRAAAAGGRARGADHRAGRCRAGQAVPARPATTWPRRWTWPRATRRRGGPRPPTSWSTARTQARDAAIAEFRGRVNSMDGLLAEFSTCVRCHNCMINCPICYCKECIFRTATFDHDSQLYYQWAERKGTVRMLPDTLLFHLTRLNHMVTSCVGCGLCSDACPADIPVATRVSGGGAEGAGAVRLSSWPEPGGSGAGARVPRGRIDGIGGETPLTSGNHKSHALSDGD